MDKQTQTPLTKGNAALRTGHYAEAIRNYAQVLIDMPDFGKHISINLTLAKKKYHTSRQSVEKQRVAVCGWELAHDTADRVHTLARCYETFAETEIIGCLFPNWGRKIWEPIRETPIAKHAFIVEDESRFIEQAIALVAAHPYDIVHLISPRAPNIFLGILYKLIWDAKVLMDIEDKELAFVEAETPISIDDYLKQHGQLPEIRDLTGKDWTRIAAGMAKEFDGVTVCNGESTRQLQQAVSRHANRPNRPMTPFAKSLIKPLCVDWIDAVLHSPGPAPDYLPRYTPSKPQYVPRLPLDTPPVEKAVKVIAFYLPQFHAIPENDAWWGKGFTEWTNVRHATPQFEGHYQPHVPDDFLGYYNLLDRRTQKKQIALARQYGIEGFCFYLYWFSGKRLLEKPVDNYLNDPTLDLPFCVCWANENWSRRWDGLDSDLLMTQHYSKQDDIDFIANAAKYLRDARYIRVNGKPLLLVYRPNLVPSMRDTALRWRKWCRENGIGDIYLAYPQSFERVDPAEYGFDAAIEFPPNKSEPPNITQKVNSKIAGFQSKVYDWRVFLDRSDAYQDPDYTLFRGATPSWDNTARKKNKGEGTIFHNNCPTLFEKWLTNAFADTRRRQKNPDEQIVFINAWNEWAEGAHLEPDQRYGYAWLEALRRAHRNVLTFQANGLNGKTLLFVDYALPLYDRFAGSRTNYMYLLVLLKMGLKVMYLPADFKHVEPYSTELKNLGVEILAGDWFRNNWKAWFKEKGAEIDYAFIHKPDPGCRFLDVILNHTNAAIVYQCHDLHYLRLQRQAELTGDHSLLDEANFFWAKETHLFSASDALLTFSNVEEGIIKKDFPHKQVYTVPLFFYEEKPKPKYDFSKRRDLLYVGGFDHAPNRDAVKWFCQEVLPIVLRRLPNIVFNVVGANPPKEIEALSSANVKILGKVSEEGLQALYDSVKLTVIPLRFGAGVKGKVIETMHHAIPLVSTSIGLEGISGIGQVTTPKDDPEAFAAEILALYQDMKLWVKKSALSAKLVADHFTEQKTAEQIKEIFATAKTSEEVRRNTAIASLEENPLRTIAFYLPQYHPIPENDEWWGKGFTEWRNVSQAKPLFTGHYQPHVPADLGFYDLRLEEARIAQADLAREHGIHGFCYYHYWFNGKRLLERPAEEMLASGKPDFPFCLCWANENWTRRWDGLDSSILIKQVYSEADDRAHIQDLFRFFTDSRYIRVNGKPLFLVYRTENMPDPARTAAVWREEARKADIGDLYLVRVESDGCVNPHEIGFDAALEFAPDWDRMGSMVKSYGPDDPELPEIVDLPSDVYDNNYTRDYVELMKQMLKKDQPTYPWFRCVTPAWDNSARRSEKAVILLGSSPPIYQQWLKNIIKKTVAYNHPGERLVFINAWNEWAEGNHLEPCIKWGRAYLKATKSGIENGLSIDDNSGRLSDHIPNSSSKLIGKDGDLELATSLVKLMAEKDSPKAIVMSFEEFYNLGNLTYLKGWAAINDNVSTEGTDILILVHEPGDKVRVIIPAKRKRPEITAHFKNGCNYDFSGFEALTKQIDPNDKITVVIKRNGEMFWQSYR